MPSHLLALVASMGALLSGPPAVDPPPQLVPLPQPDEDSRGAESHAITLACSESLDTLKDFFFNENVPFRNHLVRSQGGVECHLFYEPTVPGFRAFPDDDRVAELVFDVDSLSFLETGTTGRGDAVGALEEILREARLPLRVSILLPREVPLELYEQARNAHFDRLNHSITLEGPANASSLSWAQDYFKAGLSSQGVTVLVPHSVIEENPGDGPRDASLIRHLGHDDARIVRSKLAWEGGDLQFTLDPKDPRKLVLYYGAAAKRYWGTALTPAEYEYVLTLEFGADRAVDLGGLAPHVDYVVSFLPKHKTALFAVPETGNHRLAVSIAESLIDRFGRHGCPNSLLELRNSLDEAGPIDEHRVRTAIDLVRKEELGSSLRFDHSLARRMESFVETFCPDRRSCFSSANQERMIGRDPTLFNEWVAVARDARNEGAILEAHLELIASQIDEVPSHISQRIRRKIGELEALGFEVVRVPALRVNLGQDSGWPGVSYVNLLTIGSQLFVPSFGLGEAEDRLLAGLARDLGPDYSVVPVFSTDVLIGGGGIHCLFGIIRTPPHVADVERFD